jgi:hypothetical protein
MQETKLRRLVKLTVVTLAPAALALGADFLMPDWMKALPEGTHFTATASAMAADSSYVVALPTPNVATRYQDQWRKAGVTFTATFNGIGTTLSALSSNTFCVVRIVESDGSTRVNATCAPAKEASRPQAPIGTVLTGAFPVRPLDELKAAPTPYPAALVRSGGLADAKSDLSAIQSEILAAQKEDLKFSGGLVKALSSSTVASLRQTEAMLQQKIVSFESGAPTVRLTPPDAQKLIDVEGEIASTRLKIDQQELEVSRHGGGLIQAMSLATLETMRQTVAMLEQRRTTLKYALPQTVPDGGISRRAALSSATPAQSVPPDDGRASAAACLKIQTVDSSVLSTNNVFTELAWKVDIANSCTTPFSVRTTFKIFDQDDFELDSTSQDVYVASNGIGNARGRMLVSPPEKARRMRKQRASLSLR